MGATGRWSAGFARVLGIGLVVVAAAVAARGLERRNTWYLASDQFSFLTFAGDLEQGRVLHPTGDIERLTRRPPTPGEPRPLDALYQTYFWSADRLYSRYPPGFPALLAAAGAIGGETAQHLLNPTLFLLLIFALVWTTWEALRGQDRSLAAGAAVVAAWLLLLVPTQLHLWGITLVRDLPAHLLAFLALAAALRGAAGGAGLLLGLACTMRPDALLYAASVAAVLVAGHARARDHLVALAALGIGAAPLLVYNAVTRGHPFAFTQSGEFDRLWSSLGDARIVLAQTLLLPSGGGFRMSHLASSLPGNVATLARSFAWIGPLAAIGVAWSVRVRPLVAAAFVPYVVLAVPFYSFWSHPDPRYLAGVSLCLLPLAATGIAVITRRLVAPETPALQRGAGAVGALLFAALGWSGFGRESLSGPGAPEVAVGVGLLVAASGSRWIPSPRGRRLLLLAPGLALAVVGLTRMATGSGARDPFQRPQVERARAALGAVIPDGSLLIAGETLGRPAENVTHYTGITAHYPGELALLRSSVHVAASLALLDGRRVFLLVDPGDTTTARTLSPWASLRVVEQRSGERLYDWFVDPAAAPRGARLVEVVVSPENLASLRALDGRPPPPRAGAGGAPEDRAAPPGRD